MQEMASRQMHRSRHRAHPRCIRLHLLHRTHATCQGRTGTWTSPGGQYRAVFAVGPQVSYLSLGDDVSAS